MQNDDALALGPALRLLRARRRLRQYQVAERSGITKAMLSSYENGGTKPSLQTLMALLAGLESDLSELQQALDMIRGGRVPGEESEPHPSRDSQVETEDKATTVRVSRLNELLTLLERIATALEGTSRPVAEEAVPSISSKKAGSRQTGGSRPHPPA